jgi:thioredoxin reductase (NADPH)
MEIPGESQYKDIGISYCATCDGHLTHNKMTIVIGDNDEAVSSAIYLSTLSKNITLVFEKDKIEGKISLKDLKNKGITVLLNKTPVEVFGDTYNLKGLKIRDKSNSSIEEIKADFIFVFYGYVASTDFLKDFPIMKNGVISINSDKSTKIKGLFAAGDVSKNENRQIITAVNDGAIAAMSAIAFVEKK